MTKPKPQAKSYGTSTKLGVTSDIPVPIVKTVKPKVTVVKPTPRKPR